MHCILLTFFWVVKSQCGYPDTTPRGPERPNQATGMGTEFIGTYLYIYLCMLYLILKPDFVKLNTYYSYYHLRIRYHSVVIQNKNIYSIPCKLSFTTYVTFQIYFSVLVCWASDGVLHSGMGRGVRAAKRTGTHTPLDYIRGLLGGGLGHAH